MLRLLSIELDKIKRNKAAKVITIVYCLLITAISLIASYEFDFAGVNFRIADQGIFNFPFIWHFNAYMAAWLKIFFAIVIVSIVANEYSYGTLKQNLIDGLSKKEFVASKFLAVLLFSFISTVFLFIVSMTLGLFFSDFMEIGIIFSDMEYLFGYFIKLVTFFSFCMFLAIWIKRSAFALGFLGVWQVFEGILYIVFSYLKNVHEINLIDSVYNFLPLNAMSDLIVEPITRLGGVQTLANQVGESFDKSYNVPALAIFVCLAWTSLFVYWSYVILKRRDL
ncbi:ABC transporter permease [Patiriisocius sp. Uisw_017]|jgi:ABC-type transport system involved in multi-copper enzyme maturation permease subunit|uniref:ABC transporter permease n=1 Tax=Patiriisocius sp. Uisw_017 TaxID=3230968 RepID=UPI0039E7AF6A